MAASSGRKASSSHSNKRNTGSAKAGSRSAAGAGRSAGRKAEPDEQQLERDSALFHEIGLTVLFVAMLILFFCNFGIIGPVGNAVSGFLFGVFGFTAYVVPILLFLAAAFWYANAGNPSALRKLIAGIVLFLMVGVVCDLAAGDASSLTKYAVKTIYENCRAGRNGGGVLAGSICYLMQHYLETFGAVLVVLLCSVVCLILLTEKSLLAGMKNGGSRMRERSREDAERRRENAEARRREQEEFRTRREEERRLKAEERENEKILRMEKKVSGVMLDTTISKQEENVHRDDVHEITYQSGQETSADSQENAAPAFDFEKVRIRSMHQVMPEESFSGQEEDPEETQGEPEDSIPALSRAPEPFVPSGAEWEELSRQSGRVQKEEAEENRETVPAGFGPRDFGEQEHVSAPRHADGETEIQTAARPRASYPSAASAPVSNLPKEKAQAEKKVPAKYMFPPLSRLQKGVAATGDSTKELKETAMRLQQTLNTFGVRVTITDISQGPSVTRYELQPEQGVKVSKIVGLADDIKLNLAATDIRIEAPIPGKAAIGIEVPNRENMPVALRDLLESPEFRDFPSNIAFAVGKDIAGKVVVADIAKMPHMLIAGATGSGKSVCINTLIMSILYKAHPDDVKLIMVDPKVVELSVYNGIPHLLIPVVTDPKKASAALHWGVTEMEDRYRKFADFNVRDLKGYNKKVETMQESGEPDAPAKLPQIVIIVDELADLMMVCPGEVEESICRLAQLARAAGIHLIIATQRPSVDVITGLIKANMPSRVAFSVSSGVDSRTILDMNGAEKLLGKGDMLFYPQGYSKPARVQGAFVSDKEVSDVVDFLKNQTLGNVYAEDVEEKIRNLGSSSGGGAFGDSESELDELFEKAGRFIIEHDQDRASIGMLQRALKIGFNRAARIMDQLSEYEVVSAGEGTKPRKVLMSIEQFEQLVEEVV